MFRKQHVVYLSIVLTLIITISPAFGDERHFFKRADFTRVVFVGDSLTAGFQSGGLSIEGQTNGYAAQIARQAGFGITLPLVSEDGIPAKLLLENINR